MRHGRCESAVLKGRRPAQPGLRITCHHGEHCWPMSFARLGHDRFDKPGFGWELVHDPTVAHASMSSGVVQGHCLQAIASRDLHCDFTESLAGVAGRFLWAGVRVMTSKRPGTSFYRPSGRQARWGPGLVGPRSPATRLVLAGAWGGADDFRGRWPGRSANGGRRLQPCLKSSQ